MIILQVSFPGETLWGLIGRDVYLAGARLDYLFQAVFFELHDTRLMVGELVVVVPLLISRILCDLKNSLAYC
jgi:hypothetical protein